MLLHPLTSTLVFPILLALPNSSQSGSPWSVSEQVKSQLLTSVPGKITVEVTGANDVTVRVILADGSTQDTQVARGTSAEVRIPLGASGVS
jgi:hypothetical protein